MEKRGFTLVEVIVASLILVFTVAGMLFIFASEKAALERAGRRIQAMDFARQTLEQLKNEVRADTWLTGTISAGTHNTEAFLSLSGYKLGDSFNAAREFTITDIDIDSSGGDPDYKSITVAVDWVDPSE